MGVPARRASVCWTYEFPGGCGFWVNVSCIFYNLSDIGFSSVSLSPLLSRILSNHPSWSPGIVIVILIIIVIVGHPSLARSSVSPLSHITLELNLVSIVCTKSLCFFLSPAARPFLRRVLLCVSCGRVMMLCPFLRVSLPCFPAWLRKFLCGT